jgi:choline dehydrogenase
MLAAYDYIVCGSGSSGRVVARRLAADLDATVLLLESGGDDEAASVSDPAPWSFNAGSERD